MVLCGAQERGFKIQFILVSLTLNRPHFTFLFAFLCALSKLGVEQSSLFLSPDSLEASGYGISKLGSSHHVGKP